jgi:hypothetical protein
MGIVDRTVHERQLPHVIGNASEGRLVLHGNHGLQAFTFAALTQIHPRAHLLWEQASRAYQHKTQSHEVMPWAFDIAMALASLDAGIGPSVLERSSNSVRNRPWKHVVEQLDAVSLVCDAYVAQLVNDRRAATRAGREIS